MNEQQTESVKYFKKTINIKELYKEKPEKVSTPSFKNLPICRPRFQFHQSVPKILPNLSIKPRTLLKCNESPSRSGMIIKTFTSSRNIRGFLVPKYFKSVHNSVVKERKVVKNDVGNNTEIQPLEEIELNSRYRMKILKGPKRGLKDLELDGKTREKFKALQEMLMKDYTLSGWEIH